MVRIRAIKVYITALLLVLSLFIYVNVDAFLDSKNAVKDKMSSSYIDDSPHVSDNHANVIRPERGVFHFESPEKCDSKCEGHGEVLETKKRQWVEVLNHSYEVPEVPPLPVCPPGVELDPDNRVLSMLQLCSAEESLKFDPILEIWRYTTYGTCGGRFVTYDRDAALVRDVIVDKQFAVANVVNQTQQEDGYYAFKPDFFRLQCDHLPDLRFRGESTNHLWRWKKASVTYSSSAFVDDIISDFTLAITRYEYHHIYHTLTDIFNAFLALKYFNLNPADVRILLIDTHPNSQIEPLYNIIFKSVTKLHQLNDVTFFNALFWNRIGYHSELADHSKNTLPYIEEFRQFILNHYNITKYPPLNCNALTVTLISRKDYVTAQGNQTRIIQRKFYNDEELITTLKSSGHPISISHVFLEQLNLEKQFHLVTRTDILIGMHGAGLTHALFLPPHAGVIELIPKYWNNADWHFKSICQWRNLHYTRWRNEDPANEFDNYQTKIPPTVLIYKMSEILSAMCPKPW